MKEAQVFTATRIVALTIIGVLVVGLVYLRLGGRGVPNPDGMNCSD